MNVQIWKKNKKQKQTWKQHFKNFQFFILAAVFAITAANSYKAATYEQVTHVSESDDTQKW